MTRIENWTIRIELYGATRLSGEVYGHKSSRHPDGKGITTTPIVSVNRENKTCKTHSGSEYELGTPECSSYTDPFTGLTSDPIEFLHRRVNDFIDGQQYLYRIKAEEKMLDLKTGKYPLYRDDVLVKGDKGYTKLTGICMCNLPISDDEVEHWDRVVCLSMW